MAQQQQQAQAQQSNTQQGQNQQQQGQGQGQQGGGESSKNAQDPHFTRLQTAANILSSRLSQDGRIEQSTELSEVLNCQFRLLEYAIACFKLLNMADVRTHDTQQAPLETMFYLTTRHGSLS